MSFLSRKETYDSNTPSDLSSHRRSPKGITIQSDQGFTSNSSVHTTSPATTCGDLFDYTEQNLGGSHSISHLKYSHFQEKPTFRFSNQSQSTSEAGSVRNSIAFSSPTPEIRSLNIPSFEDEDEFSNDILLRASAPALPEPDEARAREARVLESKVARVASRTCSVEEVTALQKEVDRWLTEVTAADEPTALLLSSLLLKAILVNHIASSDASKNAEATFKLKVGELEQEKGRLEVELRKKYDEAIEETRRLREQLITPVHPSPMPTSNAVSLPVKDIGNSVEEEDHYFKPRSLSPEDGEHTPVEYPPPLITPASKPMVVGSAIARFYDMAAPETNASLPHPTPSAYSNRRHEKEKEKLRELSRKNSSRIRALQEMLVPKSGDEAERVLSNRRQLLNAILADAPTPQSSRAPIQAAPPPSTPPPPPPLPSPVLSRRPTTISHASAAAEAIERERERRRKQSNEHRSPETPVINVPPPPLPPPPQNHAQRFAPTPPPPTLPLPPPSAPLRRPTAIKRASTAAEEIERERERRRKQSNESHGPETPVLSVPPPYLPPPPQNRAQRFSPTRPPPTLPPLPPSAPLRRPTAIKRAGTAAEEIERERERRRK